MRYKFRDKPGVAAKPSTGRPSTANDQAAIMRGAIHSMNDKNKSFWARDEDSRELVFSGEPGSVYVSETAADGTFCVFKVAPQRAKVDTTTMDRRAGTARAAADINRRNAAFWDARQAR